MEEGQGAFDFARQFPLLARAERLRSERIHRMSSRGKRRRRREEEEEEDERRDAEEEEEQKEEKDPEGREQRDAQQEEKEDAHQEEKEDAEKKEEKEDAESKEKEEKEDAEEVAWVEESAVLCLQRWYRWLRRRRVWRRWCERRRLRLLLPFQEWRELTERHARLREVLDPWLDGPPARAPLLCKLDSCVFDARAVYREMGRGRMAFLFHRLWLKLRMFCRWKERLMMRLFVPEEDGMS